MKLKSVTIIHSATTETVRLPDDNTGIIVHTAVRTKVPFKKKVRGERKNAKTSNVVNGNYGLNKTTKTTKQLNKTAAHAHLRNSKIITAEQKKPTKTKKNRISNSNSNNNNTAAASTLAALGVEKPSTSNESNKKFKKLRKHSKEIIDYSGRNNATSSTANAHTNTLSKVHKWLLESPIVAQPLSHIEHSSKVRKVMSKSQSTPERLVQKSPQKSKSLGNLANEKVKLQVVYKPPFRFALRLSKNAKVKTHAAATNGFNNSAAMAKLKRQQESNRLAVEQGQTEKTKRAALLIRGNNDEDNQILTLNEPNYETLNVNAVSNKIENPCYENMAYTQLTNSHDSRASGSRAVSRSSSNQRLNYSRSNSLTHNNPFTQRSSRKLSDSERVSMNNTNFGSTQNLIASQSNSNPIAKSKKRSSLNLKSSLAKNGKDPPVLAAKRSTSNLNLRRNSSGNNILPLSLPPDAVEATITPLPQLSVPQTRNSRSSFSNIPRATLTTAASNNLSAEHRRSRNNMPQIFTQTSVGSNGSAATTSSTASSLCPTVQKRTISMRHFQPPTTTTNVTTEQQQQPQQQQQQQQPPSEFACNEEEITVSDVENLVS